MLASTRTLQLLSKGTRFSRALTNTSTKSTMKIPALATPESCLDGITDFPYVPSYLDNVAGGLRLAYYDIPANTNTSHRVFLCLHGTPTWSYLYRHMIPELVTSGRVLCVDLLGFGRSDKPSSTSLAKRTLLVPAAVTRSC